MVVVGGKRSTRWRKTKVVPKGCGWAKLSCRAHAVTRSRQDVCRFTRRTALWVRSEAARGWRHWYEEVVETRWWMVWGDGASEKDLNHAYNQATTSEERACIQVFALRVTLLYPLPKVETLMSLANTLIYAFKLPENFLRVKPVDSLKLAHSMFPHLFPLTT